MLTAARSSIVRLEAKLNNLLSEVRTGRRAGSIISDQGLLPRIQTDQEAWTNLQRELKDIGISTQVITEKRSYIIQWFQQAVATGKLEEDLPLEENLPSADDHREIDMRAIDDLETKEVWTNVPTKPLPRQILQTSARGHSDDSLGASVSLDHHPRPQAESNVVSVRDSAPGTSGARKDQIFIPSMRKALTWLGKKERTLDDNYLLSSFPGTDLGDLTPLHLVALRNGFATLQQRWTGESGWTSDIDEKTSRGYTALHFASAHAAGLTAEYLLLLGAGINAQTADGSTALHFASAHGNVAMIKTLLKNGADRRKMSFDGDQALHKLCRPSLTKACKTCEFMQPQTNSTICQLLSGGLNPEALNEDGKTAIMVAAESNQGTLVSEMLKQGIPADPKVDGSVYTALFLAAQADHTYIVQLLLQHGADVYRQFGHSASTLFSYPINGSSNLVERLLRETHYYIDRRIGNDQTTFLMQASARGDDVNVKKLLDLGADVKIKSASGESALFMAVNRVNILIYQNPGPGESEMQTIQLLLDAGSPPCGESLCGLDPVTILQVISEEQDFLSAETYQRLTAVRKLLSRYNHCPA